MPWCAARYAALCGLTPEPRSTASASDYLKEFNASLPLTRICLPRALRRLADYATQFITSSSVIPEIHGALGFETLTGLTDASQSGAHDSMLCHAMLCYTMLCDATLRYAVVWYSMVWYGYGMVWCGMVWYGMDMGMVWHGTVW